MIVLKSLNNVELPIFKLPKPNFITQIVQDLLL